MSVALATGQPAGAAAGSPDTTIALPRLGALGARWSLPRPSLAVSRAIGLLALAIVSAGTLAVVLAATSSPSVLVPRSSISFPSWFAGPLRGLLGSLGTHNAPVDLGLTIVVAVMGLAYLVVVATSHTFSRRIVIGCVVALHAILLLSPPLQLTDVFNYIGYARLGALHGLNPYNHVLSMISHDPVYQFQTWARLPSPYGPLFTALTYPLALIPLPIAYWLMKSAAVLTSLGFLVLVWVCARRFGRDPQVVLAFVAFNPIYLIYAVGGFHNDFFMLLPSMGAVALLATRSPDGAARRELGAGALLMVAVAIKFTAVVVLPFLLLASPSVRGRLRVLGGAAAAAIPLAALSVALFGFTLPNLSDQSTLLTPYSIPNLLGYVLGLGGGMPWVLHLFDVALALSIAWMLLRRYDWIAGAGWATLALLASLAWLVPWYIVWVLPLAALSSSVRLRRATLVMSAFLVLTFTPSPWTFLANHGFNPMNGAAGVASSARQRMLEY
ncbi:MAG TPA: glycosyltransferase family 87 protein [Solirubrobacteraceae bacterium]|nr:glycosyltransferase family 87 protein [Solirubrobacteraceae bacterium]